MEKGNDFVLERFFVGMLQTNCYLLGDGQTGTAVVIDPGGNSDRIARRIADLGLKLEAILNTHAHFDHVMDAWALKESAGGRVYLNEKDEPLLRDRTVGLSAVLGSVSGASKGSIDQWLNEGDELAFGAIKFQVLETPGHTPGHVSFYMPQRKIIFVGDTLFAGSIGRTDFPGGSYDQLIRSVREKLFTLDGETVVYPGHGPETTVEQEKKSNPFFT